MADAVALADLAADPHPVLARLRAEAGVVWIPALEGWVVTRHDLATTVLRDAATFTVHHPDFTTARVVGESMLSLDGLEHTRHRTPFLPFHRAAALREGLESWIDAEAARLVQSFAPRGRAELRGELAAPLAAGAVTRFLGLVDVAVAELLGWYRAIVGSVDALSAGNPANPESQIAMSDLADAVRRTTRERPESMIGAIVGDSGLTIEEVVSNVAVLMFGAIETAEGMMANGFWHLLSAPGHLEQVSEDPDLIGAALDESLRLEPAATRVDRYATRHVSLDGAAIAENDLVIVSLAAAGRDPAVFEQPDTFSLTRPNGRQHLAFAVGPHTCIGQPMARHEMTAALVALSTLRDVRLDTSASAAPSGLVFRKPATVVVEWRT